MNDALFPSAEMCAADDADGQRAERLPARRLVGCPLLCVMTMNVDGKLAVVFRLRNGGDCYWFHVGTVVAEQLRTTRLPTWAMMQMYKGTKHPFFYKLNFAQTTSVERIKPCSEPLQQSGETSCKPPL
jgi:hypothetical protein